VHSGVSSEVTVWVLPEDEDDDDDEDDDEGDTDDEEDEGGASLAVIVASGSGVSAAVASTRFEDREEMDGRRRRLVRRTGGAGAVREGTSVAVAWDCAFVDAPTGLRFEGDLNNELARVNTDVGAEPCVSVCDWGVLASGLRFEGDLFVGVDPVPASSWLRPFSSSSTLSKSNILANPRLLLPALGVSTKASTSLAQGVGVASGSPVSVSMTPFMADARGNAGGGARRSTGVSR
jgi:hypothetical protein